MHTEMSNFSITLRQTRDGPTEIEIMDNFHHPLGVLEQCGNQENKVPDVWTVDRGSRL